MTDAEVKLLVALTYAIECAETVECQLIYLRMAQQLVQMYETKEKQ